jgi:hypothetical protein
MSTVAQRMGAGAMKRSFFSAFRRLDFFFGLLHRADLSKRWSMLLAIVAV